MTTKIINLTPHEIRIFSAEGKALSVPPSGIVARVEERSESLAPINGIPVTKNSFGDIIYSQDTYTCSCGEHGLGATFCNTCQQPVFKNNIVVEPPPRKPGVIYLVSSLIAQRAQREDFYAPDTGPKGAVRDPKGNIIGVKGLQQFF